MYKHKVILIKLTKVDTKHEPLNLPGPLTIPVTFCSLAKVPIFNANGVAENKTFIPAQVFLSLRLCFDLC